MKKNVLTFISKQHHPPKKPGEIVCKTRELLLLVYSHHQTNNDSAASKQQKKIQEELSKLIGNVHAIFYGNPETLPDPKACTELTAEFFKDNRDSLFRLLISCFPKLDWESQKHVSEVVASLLRQQVQSHLITAEYVEENLDIVDSLITGVFVFNSDDTRIALLYNVMLRECIRRSQIVARHVLGSEQHMKRFLEYVQLPNYTFASHVGETLEVLLTRHRSTVAEFLSRNYDWFFAEFNSKLLESHNILTKYHALKLLGDMLLHPSSRDVMVRYVSSTDNLKIVMNLLKESSWSVQLNAFNVFKLFTANAHKPKGVVDILTLNKSKLLQFLDGFKLDKDGEQFEADKAQVIREIAPLKEINLKSIEYKKNSCSVGLSIIGSA
ncbi:hypothetical protein L1049_027308 [Liquidambar formosana]|uniref:Uncharacterized protein n=1 Tax=Liquidambar formosana TaxID=63359 RepID=A0AAP0N4P8_LIQFO